MIDKTFYTQVKAAGDNANIEQIATNLKNKLRKHTVKFGEYVISADSIDELKQELKKVIPTKEWSYYEL